MRKSFFTARPTTGKDLLQQFFRFSVILNRIDTTIRDKVQDHFVYYDTTNMHE